VSKIWPRTRREAGAAAAGTDVALLVLDDEPRISFQARTQLVLPSLLMRDLPLPWRELVRVHVPSRPVVAFSVRDLRSPHIVRATQVARAHGFETVVRSPGGRMVAYDGGAVVVDHVVRSASRKGTSRDIFEESARAHASVLRSLTDVDIRVGELEGEFCPGEFSINAAGISKVVGSAQRITGSAWLFSTVVLVRMSESLRRIIETVSAELGYPLKSSTISGLADFDSTLTTTAVARALGEDYRARLGLSDGTLPDELVEHARTAEREIEGSLPFGVDDWARANPMPA
jgi:octanoyl-[GcvH]:protein N-octanoyltransferase